MILLDIICSIILIGVSAGMIYLGFMDDSNYNDTTKKGILVIVGAIAYALLQMWMK